jgi:hypothetical protein
MAFLWSLVITKIVTSFETEDYRTSVQDIPMSLNHNEPWELSSLHSTLIRSTPIKGKMNDLRSAYERVHHQHPSLNSHESGQEFQPGLALLSYAFSS